MNIAIITSGRLPVPSVMGGAVESLIDAYVEKNETVGIHNFTVFSVKPPCKTDGLKPQKRFTQYEYIDIHGLLSHIRISLFQHLHKHQLYDCWMDYFLDRVIKRMKSKSFDVILIENRPLFAIRLKQVFETPLLLHMHNDMLSDPGNQKQRDARAALKEVICVSDFIKKKTDSIQDGMNTSVVLNGIDIKRFKEARRTERSVLNLNEEDFVVVFVGRLQKEKGIGVLLDAMTRIENERIKLLVIGSSFYNLQQSDNEYGPVLAEKATVLGDRVKFTGYVEHDMLPSYMKSADVAVLPSIWDEPFGLTIAEAMAAGLPVVSTRSGGIPEICEGAAVLLDRGENLADNLADTIQQLYFHPERLQALRKMACERVAQFGIESYATEMLERLND